MAVNDTRNSSLRSETLRNDEVIDEMSSKKVDEGCGDCDLLQTSVRDLESGLAEPLVAESSPSDSDNGLATESDHDPWDLPEFKDDSTAWSDLSCTEKCRRVLVDWIGRCILLIALLYFFICSLDFLSSSFRLLGGKAAGSAFTNSALLQNPIAGLMIGVLATVLVQSSSTSTSIVVTMVASGIIGVRPAIPIIMGANIGTSVTNTIVSISQSNDKDQFRRAFAGATVHDMFNWLSVIFLLPLEVATGYLFHLTSKLVTVLPQDGSGTKTSLLKTLTKPLTKLVIQLDKHILEKIAIGADLPEDVSLIKHYCRYEEQEVNVTRGVNQTVTRMLNYTNGDASWVLIPQNVTELVNETVTELGKVPIEKCTFLFNNDSISDTVVGIILLGISLVMLCGCLVLMVKNLKSALKGKMAGLVRNTLNANLPGKLAYFTGYLVMIVGAILTMLVQSSSVFTSAVTPLVGVGLLKMERMYPLTLGANIGTTTTGLLAAMAASSDKLHLAMQIALCHLFFNLSGILLFYVVPCMRWPVQLAKIMGNTTAEYRWFAVVYLLLMFFVLPGFVFALSMAGPLVFAVVGSLIFGLFVVIVLMNVAQRKCPRFLPKKLRNWDYLPLWMRSLGPIDRAIFAHCNCCVKKCCGEQETEKIEIVVDLAESPDTTMMELTPSEKSLLMKETKEVVEDIVKAEESKLNDDEKLERIRTGFESGYVTAAPTPCITVQNTPVPTPYGPTPCVSRVPSFARLQSSVKPDETHDEEDDLNSQSDSSERTHENDGESQSSNSDKDDITKL